MSVNTVPLSALVQAHAVLREIHELVGPDPRAVINGKLYARLVSAETEMRFIVVRLTRETPVEVAAETIYEKSARWAWPDGRPDL